MQSTCYEACPPRTDVAVPPEYLCSKGVHKSCSSTPRVVPVTCHHRLICKIK